MQKTINSNKMILPLSEQNAMTDLACILMKSFLTHNQILKKLINKTKMRKIVDQSQCCEYFLTVAIKEISKTWISILLKEEAMNFFRIIRIWKSFFYAE